MDQKKKATISSRPVGNGDMQQKYTNLQQNPLSWIRTVSSVCVCGAFFTSSSHPKDPGPEGFVVDHLLVVSMTL